MGLSYWESQMTPRDVMHNDLEMMQIESIYSKPPPESKPKP